MTIPGFDVIINRMELSEITLNEIENKIKLHHQIYRIPVKAESWEDIADQAINGDISTYTPFNHNINYDLQLNVEDYKYKSSLKTGVIKGDRLEFSSHRLSRFPTLQEKLDFLDNVDYDNFLFLSRTNGKIWDKTYYIGYLSSKSIIYNNLDWTTKLGKKGRNKDEISEWIGTNDDQTIKCIIRRSLSDQLWVDLDFSVIKPLKKITIC